MVLHIPGTADSALTLKLVEQLSGGFADDVHQHIQPAAMGHADDDFLNTLAAGLLDHLVHHRDQALATFQRKPLLPHVTGVQVTLQTLGRHQPVQQLHALLSAQIESSALAFQPFLNPALLGGLVDVHVLGTNRADVHIAQETHDVAQRPLRGRHQRAGVERDRHIGLVQPVIARVQLRDWRAVAQFQGIEIGRFMASGPIGVDDAQDRRLLFCRLGAESLAALHASLRLQSQTGERVTNRAVGDIAGALSLRLHIPEILPPIIVDRFRIGEKAFIEFFYERGVAAEQGRTLAKLLDERTHSIEISSVVADVRTQWLGRDQRKAALGPGSQPDPWASGGNSVSGQLSTDTGAWRC